MAEPATAAALLAALDDLGVTHIVGVPDNGSAALFELAGDHPTIDLLTATREGEAVHTRIVDSMYRMKMFFEDAGKWAFMKNMGMPGSIKEEIVAQVETATARPTR